MKVKTSPEEKPKKRGGIQPRNRTKYTASQLNAMETTFLMSQYPDSTAIEELGQAFGVTVERISIWFQNRRSKFKRQSKNVHMAWMRKQIFSQDSHQNHLNPPSQPSLSQPEKRHVLSPPEEEAKQSSDKPRSNLYYMPMNSNSPNDTPLLSGASTTFNYSNCSQATTSQPSYATSSHNHLLMSHLLNDASTTSSMATPGYPPCNYSNNSYNVYNSYPYYSQINPIYSTNQQQTYSTQQSQGV